jgi:hypothetical protein
MDADHIIALAQSLRMHARNSGRDLNAANLFVHTVLMRAMKFDGDQPPHLAAAASRDRTDRPDART